MAATAAQLKLASSSLPGTAVDLGMSNDFYELILDHTMANSCGFHTTPDLSLEDAQTAKLHLVCRKLGLQRGSRHLIETFKTSVDFINHLRLR